MKKTTLLLFCFLYATPSPAANWQDCLELQNKGEPGKALECYNLAVQEQQASEKAAEHSKPLIVLRNKSLAEEWTPSDIALNTYKQTYFLFYSHSSSQNNAPDSPNPLNQIPYTYPLDNKEMKFQISIKSHVIGAKRHALWAAYTQLSFWQVYDTKHSGPFRESNYEPELIYSYRPGNMEIGGFRASFLNAGFVHHSNGQPLPRSRSWNRIYAQAGMEREFGDNQRLALLLRGWKRLWGGTIDDDNPDIMHYLGHGDIEVRYYNGGIMLSAIGRIRSLQLDLALPMDAWNIRNSNFHLQLFSGYGESLLDYNHRHSTIGLGLSMPFK